VGFGAITHDSTTLTANEGNPGPIFTDANGDNYSSSTNEYDLSLYHNNDTVDTISFDVGKAAFSGSITLDLSSSLLALIHTKGNIVTGYSTSVADFGLPNTTIGQWEVVPEPSTWLLVLTGFGALLFWRRVAIRA
jgi:hypothetical protein